MTQLETQEPTIEKPIEKPQDTIIIDQGPSCDGYDVRCLLTDGSYQTFHFTIDIPEDMQAAMDEAGAAMVAFRKQEEMGIEIETPVNEEVKALKDQVAELEMQTKALTTENTTLKTENAALDTALKAKEPIEEAKL